MTQSGGGSGARLQGRWIRRAAALAALAALVGADPAAGQAAADAPRLGLREVIATTLAHSAAIAIAEEDVRAMDGALLQSAGAFDPRTWATVASERSEAPGVAGGSADPGGALTTELNYGTGVDWRLRSGIVVSPSVTYSRRDVSTQEGLPSNVGVADLTVTVPMLRGRGGGMQTASERAAVAQRTAGGADLLHLRAATIQEAVSAYWGYVAAVQNLDVYREAEARAQRLVEQTQKLIEADERPAADRLSVEASLASRRATRLGGEQSVTAARQVLAEAMGIPAGRLAAIPLPADSFPAAPAGAAALLPGDSAVAVALARRADLSAARARRAAAQQLLRGNRREAWSQLDLNLGVGYTGLESGGELDRLFAPFYSSRRGLQAQVSVTYGLPFGNRAAIGGRLRSAAADQRAAIAVEELSRVIALEVMTAVETLERSVEELQLASDAVRLHSAAVVSENQKFRLGSSTVFEVIQAEDGLTSATLGAINTRRRYAVALAQLRFRTGTLQAESPEELDAGVLTSLDHPEAR
jgi:outer membrane protein